MLYHQIIGEGTGRFLVITSTPTKFKEIPQIRGIVESDLELEPLKKLMKSLKISEFSEMYSIPINTVNKLRAWLDITKSSKKRKKSQSNITLTKVE